jgi:hypothetical protein
LDTNGNSTSIVQVTRPTGVQLNPAELRQNHVKIEAVSKYLAGLTLSEIGKPGSVRPGQGGQPAFDAVFAGSLLDHVDC